MIQNFNEEQSRIKSLPVPISVELSSTDGLARRVTTTGIFRRSGDHELELPESKKFTATTSIQLIKKNDQFPDIPPPDVQISPNSSNPHLINDQSVPKTSETPDDKNSKLDESADFSEKAEIEKSAGVKNQVGCEAVTAINSSKIIFRPKAGTLLLPCIFLAQL